MPLNTPQDVLANEIRLIQSAEKQVSRALPRLAKQVTAENLREKLTERLEEGQGIMEAVEQSLEELGAKKGRGKNVAIEGLLEDANQLVQEIESAELFDAALIGAVQKVQHYCIAAWGTTAAFARALEQQQLVEAMERALENGKRYDEELTQLAEEEINPAMFEQAEEEGEEEEQEEKPAPRRKAASGSGRGGGAKKSAGKKTAQRGRK